MYEGGSEGSEGAPHSSLFVSSSSFAFLSPPPRSSSSSTVSPELDPSSSRLLAALACGDPPSPPGPPLTPAAACASHHHIFGPGVPLLLEEVDSILQQQHSSSRRQISSSNSKTTTLASSVLVSSSFCSTSTNGTSSSSSRKHQTSASRASESSTGTARLNTGGSSIHAVSSNRWISLLPPPLLAASFSVRVCGYAHAYLESVDCFLLRGTFSPRASLLVDVSWLSPEIVCSARDSVAATAATAATFKRCSWSSDIAHTAEQLLPHFPLLQFIGEVRPVSVRHLNAKDRLLLLMPSHRTSRFGSSTHSSRTCYETPISELSSSSSSSSRTRRCLCVLGRTAESYTSSSCISRHSSSSGARDLRKGNHCCGTRGNSSSSSTKKIEGVQKLRLGRRRSDGVLNEMLQKPERRQQQGQEQQQHEKQRQAQQLCTCAGGAEIADTGRLAVAEANDQEQVAGPGRPAGHRQTETNKGLEEEADEIEEVDDDSEFRKSERVGHETEPCGSLRRDSISAETTRVRQADDVKGEREVVGLLRARVCRQVNGLDMLRYVHALRLFRLLQRQPKPQPVQQQQRLLLWPQQHGLRRQEQQHEQQQGQLHEQQQGQLHQQQEYQCQLFLTEDRRQRKKGRLGEVSQSLSQEVRSCRQLQQEIQEPEGEQVWPMQHGSMEQERLKEPESPAQQSRGVQRQAEEKQQEAAAFGRMRKQEKKETDLGSKEEVDILEVSDIEATQRLVSS